MGNTNLKGTSKASGNQLSAFDKPPPSFRELLREASFDWAPTAILARHRRAVKGYRNADELAREICRWDRNQHQADVKRGIVAP